MWNKVLTNSVNMSTPLDRQDSATAVVSVKSLHKLLNFLKLDLVMIQLNIMEKGNNSLALCMNA